MCSEEVFKWITGSSLRARVVAHLAQPSTARQMGRRLHVNQRRVTHTFRDLRLYGVVRCLNPSARRSRVYWLTGLGVRCQKRLRQLGALPRLKHEFPKGLDWDSFGWCLYAHRSAILRAISEPAQAVVIRRRVRHQNPRIRISPSNTRDVLYLLVNRGLARKVRVSSSRHPHYILTDYGMQIRSLLFASEVLA
jgi:DNA-binding HxlR family transcriptional regulator